MLEVTHTASSTTTRFIAPAVSHKVTPNHNPISLDVTSTGALGAVTDGNLLTYLIPIPLSLIFFILEIVKYFINLARLLQISI